MERRAASPTDLAAAPVPLPAHAPPPLQKEDEQVEELLLCPISRTVMRCVVFAFALIYVLHAGACSPWLGSVTHPTSAVDQMISTHLLLPPKPHSDPVTTCDGHSYDRRAIEAWLARGHKTSPMTGVDLPTRRLYPNLALKQLAAHLRPPRAEEEEEVCGLG